MKTISKKLSSFVALFAIIGLLIPQFGLAALKGSRPDKTGTALKETLGFCQKIGEIAAKIDKQVSDNQIKIGAKKDERLAKLIAKQAEINQKKAEKQISADEARDKHFDKLAEKAKTDAEKEAVVKFKEAVLKAITDRRLVMESAMNTFRDGVKTATGDRQTAVETAINNFKSAKSAVVEKAKTDCVNGVDSKTVKQSLQNGLKSAKEAFKTERKSIEKKKDAVKALIEARKTSFENAKTAFHTVMEKAKADLKAVLGEKKEENEEDKDENKTE